MAPPKDKSDELREIKEAIKNLSKLEKLEPEKFTYPDGYAAIIANQFKKQHQLRKIFNPIKSLERKARTVQAENFAAEIKPKLAMIVPHLHYASRKGLIGKEVVEILEMIIQRKIQDKDDYQRFVDLLTAIIAYSKEG